MFFLLENPHKSRILRQSTFVIVIAWNFLMEKIHVKYWKCNFPMSPVCRSVYDNFQNDLEITIHYSFRSTCFYIDGPWWEEVCLSGTWLRTQVCPRMYITWYIDRVSHLSQLMFLWKKKWKGNIYTLYICPFLPLYAFFLTSFFVSLA